MFRVQGRWPERQQESVLGELRSVIQKAMRPVEILVRGGITDSPFRKFSLTAEQGMNLSGGGGNQKWEEQ